MTVVIDRFAEFEALRPVPAARASETTPLKLESGTAAAAAAPPKVEPLLTDFYAQVNGIKNRLLAFDNKIDEASAAHDAMVHELRTSEKARLETQLNKLLGDARQSSKLLNDEIKALGEELNNPEKLDTTQRIKAGIIGSLANRFRELLNKFQDRQRFFSDKMREDTSRRIRIVNPQVSTQELENFIESGDGDVFGKALITGDVQVKLQEIREQKEAMDKLYKSVVELQELFVDMHTLVFQQGAMIDDIAKNIEVAAVEVEKGQVATKDGLKYARSYRKKIVMITIICAIILALVLIPIILYLVGLFN